MGDMLFIRRLVQQNNRLSIDDRFLWVESFRNAATPFLDDLGAGLHVLLVCAEDQNAILSAINGEKFEMKKIELEDESLQGEWCSTDNYYGVTAAESYVDAFVKIKKYLQALQITDDQFGGFDSFIDTAKVLEQSNIDYDNVLLAINNTFTDLNNRHTYLARLKIIIVMPPNTYFKIWRMRYIPDCINYVLMAGKVTNVLTHVPSEKQKEITDTYIEKHSNTNLKINGSYLSRDSTYGHQDKNEPSLLQYAHIELPSHELNLSVSTNKEKEAM